jgi:hypothetical protein
VESGKLVEWELVDYGSGVFHVASYHDQPAAAIAAVAVGSLEDAAPQAEAAQTPECFFYRCWSALRDGCRAA